MSSFFRDGLSVEETKFSALVFSFFITLGFAMWQVIEVGDISTHVLDLLSYEILAITGINVADKIYTLKKNKEESQIGE